MDEARVNTIDVKVASAETEIKHMVSRVDRLESKLDDVLQRLTTLEERVAHLPTKETVVKIAIGIVGIIGSLTVFQGNIRHLLGLN